jgi:hypothetical protein
MESKAGSTFLIYRASYRKTASRFSGRTLMLATKAQAEALPMAAI